MKQIEQATNNAQTQVQAHTQVQQQPFTQSQSQVENRQRAAISDHTKYHQQQFPTYQQYNQFQNAQLTNTMIQNSSKTPVRPQLQTMQNFQGNQVQPQFDQQNQATQNYLTSTQFKAKKYNIDLEQWKQQQAEIIQKKQQTAIQNQTIENYIDQFLQQPTTQSAIQNSDLSDKQNLSQGRYEQSNRAVVIVDEFQTQQNISNQQIVPEQSQSFNQNQVYVQQEQNTQKGVKKNIFNSSVETNNSTQHIQQILQQQPQVEQTTLEQKMEVENQKNSKSLTQSQNPTVINYEQVPLQTYIEPMNQYEQKSDMQQKNAPLPFEGDKQEIQQNTIIAKAQPPQLNSIEIIQKLLEICSKNNIKDPDLESYKNYVKMEFNCCNPNDQKVLQCQEKKCNYHINCLRDRLDISDDRFKCQCNQVLPIRVLQQIGTIQAKCAIENRLEKECQILQTKLKSQLRFCPTPFCTFWWAEFQPIQPNSLVYCINCQVYIQPEKPKVINIQK